MTSFAVDDTTSGSGWNVTVAGNTNTGNSAVFKWYCPNTTCGTDKEPSARTEFRRSLSRESEHDALPAVSRLHRGVELSWEPD